MSKVDEALLLASGLSEILDQGGESSPEGDDQVMGEVIVTYLGPVDGQAAWRIAVEGLATDVPAIHGTSVGPATRRMAIQSAFGGVLRCGAEHRTDLGAILRDAATGIEGEAEAVRLALVAADEIEQKGECRLADIVPEPTLHQPSSGPYFRIIRALMSAGPRADDLGFWRLDSDGTPYAEQVETDKYRMGMAARQLEIPTVAPFDDEQTFTLWRDVILETSPETTMVFMVLMHKAASIPDPRGLTYISLDELIALRGVKTRQGSERKLRDDLTAEVARLAQFEVSFSSKQKGWPSKEHTVGKRIPGRLVDIVDHQTTENGRRREGFIFRPGAVLLLFLGGTAQSVRTIGRFSPALLRLNPAKDKLALGIGLYLSYLANLNGARLKFKLEKALDYAGHIVNRKRPGKTVAATLRAFQKLEDLGVLRMPEALDPERTEGYFAAWMEAGRDVTVSLPAMKLPETKPLRIPKRAVQQKKLALSTPKTSGQAPTSAQEIDGERLREFRLSRNLRQADLARWLRVSVSLVSAYERGSRRIKPNLAAQVLREWTSPSAFVL